ncbi:uncharacterized protein LOC133294717 [Gastrolobium bilobum]|uniref:uncharacterized protein LOC133294717 n=1 Tax=Gastrolobium bilobum TaxID=150636 RepID=UPI002AB16EB0|nr:uncharacterized protein LOC133294717 [Gastrolobium bilobum]
MAIELSSENFGVSMSPRISFSHDFSQSDVIPVERQQKHPLRSNSSGLNSSIDFDFCVQESLELESSSADELFSDGRILPIEIKKKNAPLKQTLQLAPQPPLPLPYAIRNNASTNKKSKKESPKESLNDEVEEKQSSKSFWRFKRSSSCGSGYGSSLCPLPLLSRSNSTGSSPSVKRMHLSKEGPKVKQNSQNSSSTTRPSHPLCPNNHQKPPLKRSHGSYANSVRVSPVLNVPPANLFGLGSIFSNNKAKSKKK